jgi:hypothetical protein
MEPRFRSNVREARPDEPIEENWRPLGPALDDFEPRGEQLAPWPDDFTVLYWWRSTYWRHSPLDG